MDTVSRKMNNGVGRGVPNLDSWLENKTGDVA